MAIPIISLPVQTPPNESTLLKIFNNTVNNYHFHMILLVHLFFAMYLIQSQRIANRGKNNSEKSYSGVNYLLLFPVLVVVLYIVVFVLASLSKRGQ